MTKNINGLNINYIDKGEGKLVVLLHGWGSNISLFSSIIELLSPKYKVVAMDMPGFGGSDEPKEPWCVDDYTDFVIDFLKDYDTEDITLLGHSFGGRVIIKMFDRDNLPFHINKVILTDSAGVLPKKSRKQKFKLKMYKISKRILLFPALKRLFPNAVETLRKKNGSSDYNAASPVMRQCLVKVVNEDLTHIFCKNYAKTLLIWGRNDTATPLADGELMNALMPDSELVVLDYSGHYAFLDEMFAFNKTLASFMNI